jgi:asparagine synthase (glutamine-hydrolysing)
VCGIAGIVDWRSDAAPADACAAMTARLARRGPDGHGVHAEPGLALGHRRLSIVDLSERGAQPMTNEDETVWLTFNGEIYNYRDLRRRLEARGHRFRSDSDSEVLVHLYEDSADDLASFLDEVRGMFAFAIWDRPRRRLVVARDRLGIKPLVYYAGDGFVAFASDIDALAACEDVPRRLDWTSVYEYLVLLSVPGPRTIYRDVSYLAPGSMLVVEDGRARETVYWSLGRGASDPIASAGEADEAIEAALDEAVALHLVADVEVGAFLSGGVDSGLVSAVAAGRMRHPLRSFSVSFPGEDVDEGPWAREAAETLGAVHTDFPVSSDFLDGIDGVVAAMDQPLAIPAAASLFHLSRDARRHVKVVLTGDGGDEVFGGYNRHRPYPVPARGAWIPPAARPAVGRLGRAVLPVWARERSGAVRKAHALSAALARDEAELYGPRVYFLDPAEALALLPAEARAEVDEGRYLDRLRTLFDACPFDDPLSRMLYVDLRTTLVDEMLPKVDRMTMAWGLEARVPLLDHVFVELGMRVPGALKRAGERGKLPLRRLVSKRLGPEVGEREKRGFNSPLDAWFVGDAATRAAVDAIWPRVRDCGAFDPDALDAVRGGVLGGRAFRSANLFALLVFGLWAAERGTTAP